MRLKMCIWLAMVCLPCMFAAQAAGNSPILVLADKAGFGLYVGEILKTEGFNEYQNEAPSDPKITPEYLAGFDVVILSQTALTASQAAVFTKFVQQGGNLIALRPDKRLAPLFGLTDAGGTMVNGYVKIETTNDIGAGLIGETLQSHVTADLYTLSGGKLLAGLYQTNGVPSSGPAVVLNNFGSGHAIAFTYNMPLNIILTRTGNWDIAGDERDGMNGVRALDMFVDHWVDGSKNALNQADEQMRLLSHCIEKLSSYKKPLPRFWYFPGLLKSIFLLSNDSEHSFGYQLEPQFRAIEAKGAHMSLYVEAYDRIPLTNALDWVARGHEVVGHPYDLYEAAHPTWTGMVAAIDEAVANSSNMYGQTMRTVCNHWILWCAKDAQGNRDALAQARIEANAGIHMDGNYVHYDRAAHEKGMLGPTGNFTGSGLPMKFCDTSGTVLDCYQLLENVADQQYSELKTPTAKDEFFDCFKTVLDRSLDDEVYSVVHVKAHEWIWRWFAEEPVLWMLDYANSKGIPVWTIVKYLDFLEMKDAATFEGVEWKDNTLSFTVHAPIAGEGLTFMVPRKYAGKTLQSVTVNGKPASVVVRKVKGAEYGHVTIAGGADSRCVAVY